MCHIYISHISDPTVDVDAPKDEQQIARNLQTLKNRLRGRGGRRGARGGRQVMMEGFGGRESQSNSEYVAPVVSLLFSDPLVD